MTSRRNFLKSGAMGFVCAAVPAVLGKVALGRTTATGGSSGGNATIFSKDMFTPHLNSTFRIRTQSGTAKLKLTNVTDLKAASKMPARIAGRESFSLLFLGSEKTAALTQETYVVEHPAFQPFSLFLVPVGSPANRQYEAIIIRL
jgi:hypothetical protein